MTAAATSAAVPSPCINICRMHAGTGFCEGCLRTIDEIARWSRLDDSTRLSVLACLPQRRALWADLQAAGLAPPAPTTGADR